MRQTIAGLALLVGLTGCKAYDKPSTTTEVGKRVEVNLPPCLQIVNIQYGHIVGEMTHGDQLLCKEEDGTFTLYIKNEAENQWTARHYNPTMRNGPAEVSK